MHADAEFMDIGVPLRELGEYDIGPLRDFQPSDEQSHQLWAVFDHAAKWADIEAGIGSLRNWQRSGR